MEAHVRAVEYAAPASVEEAVAILARHGAEARMLSGGTDIIVQAREGRRNVAVFVDAKTIPEANELRFEPDGSLHVGAAVPCAVIYENEEVARRYPALIDSASLIGGIQIQSRASLGGNLCNSSPAADSIPTLIVLGAVCHIAGPNGRREVPVEQFCTGPGRNVLREDEMLVALTFPAPKARGGASFERFIPRNEMDIAVTNAAASVVLSDDGRTFESARIAVGAVAPTPLLVEAAGAALAGQPVSRESMERAADLAGEAARPITDMRGSVAQRKHLAKVLTRRVLEKAVQRAQA
jgi:CO/xanthine dehydrogenase FAD-binding subunit